MGSSYCLHHPHQISSRIDYNQQYQRNIHLLSKYILDCSSCKLSIQTFSNSNFNPPKQELYPFQPSIESCAHTIFEWTNRGCNYKNEVSFKCINFNKLNHNQSSITSSYNPNQLQYYLAALDPTAPNLAAILTNSNIASLPLI